MLWIPFPYTYTQIKLKGRFSLSSHILHDTHFF